MAKWQGRNGEVEVAAMSDTHLLNAIRFLARMASEHHQHGIGSRVSDVYWELIAEAQARGVDIPEGCPVTISDTYES